MDQPVSVRLLTYNIRHAQGVSGIVSNPRIAKVIREIDPLVAGVTEVWRVGERYDQGAILGELTQRSPVFHAVHPGVRRDIGNLILSSPVPVATREIHLGKKRENRGCLLVDVEHEGLAFTFGVLHLSLDRASRRAQLEVLARELPRDRPVVVCGDFNAGVHEFDPLDGLLTFPLDVPPTFPSPFPFRRLDHFGYSAHWRLDALYAPFSLASDHRPLVAELTCG